MTATTPERRHATRVAIVEDIERAFTYPDDATRAAARALVEATAVSFDLSDLQHAEFGSTPGKGMWRIFRDFLKDRPAPEATADRLEDA